ncbi:fluoride efflux transporter family protein [Corynebacterium gallinarum]|uniref:Fluoride-specific ion channel FluC n=1 Tax=Corynebacterium gallinarum TaxID=2762214 RepID=A0A8I0LHJ7_9CORY|nr:fluoride efflux transporter family protein [Corynebacterium gallinarum]MBD8031175.1 fluoride efflux transporter family protein [Corynebacterium gallinarum]
MPKLWEGMSVGAGAAVGACARLALTMQFGDGLWPILAINMLGSFLMGRYRPGPFWGTGVLGGFTTFSAFAVMLVDAPLPHAVTYLTVTVVGCVAAWLVGNRWAS